jgi:site-specific DNA-cytosine methylase
VRSEMERRGYASLPVPIAASDCGAPHRRGRILLVAHLDRANLRIESGGGKTRTNSPLASIARETKSFFRRLQRVAQPTVGGGA